MFNDKAAMDRIVSDTKTILARRFKGQEQNPLGSFYREGEFIASMFNSSRFSDSDNPLACSLASQAMDCFVAERIGAMVEPLLKLHAFLVKKGATTAANAYDFNWADRFGVAFADEDKFKSMGFENQHYGFMVVMMKKYDGWATHIRTYSPKGALAPNPTSLLPKMKFLGNAAAAKANSHFNFGDCRDNGYLVTVSPRGEGQYAAERSLSNYGMLENVCLQLGGFCF